MVQAGENLSVGFGSEQLWTNSFSGRNMGKLGLKTGFKFSKDLKAGVVKTSKLTIPG